MESAAGTVVVRGLDGAVAVQIPSMQLDGASSPARPPRLIAADGTAYRLLHGALTADTSRTGDTRTSGDGPAPVLPPPPGGGGGHWRYAFRAAGVPVLAQWSGECEIPVAYEISGTRVTPIDTAGVESIALALARDGEPIVLFPPSGCGSGSGRVGVYIRGRTRASGWRRITAATDARYFRKD